MHKRYRNLLRIVGMTLSFVIISSVALFFALGYEINWAARSVKQTGILEIDLTKRNLGATLYINNEPSGDRFPVRFTHVFPGQYSVVVRKADYQEWQRTVTVEPNKVASYRDILLIKSKPTPVEVSPDDTLPSTLRRTNGIDIRENELWVNDTFITRASQDIQGAAWYVDNYHIVYQAGDTLYIAEEDGKATQRLVTLLSPAPLLFDFKDNGRILLYNDGEQLQGLELYE
jgi:hypothetical protein